MQRTRRSDSDTDGEDIPHPGDNPQNSGFRVCAVEWTPGDTKEGGDDADNLTGHEHGEWTAVEFESERIGRDINESIPRYDIDNLRPFEVMFTDNKDYDCPQRGGYTTALVLICLKSLSKFKADIVYKSSNGVATQRIL